MNLQGKSHLCRDRYSKGRSRSHPEVILKAHVLQKMLHGTAFYIYVCCNWVIFSFWRNNILQEKATPSKPGAQYSQDLNQEGQTEVASDSLRPSVIPDLQPQIQNPPTQEANHYSSELPSSSIYQLSMFNYERPKHFIQSQNPCGSRLQPPGPETSSYSSQTKQSSITIQPRQCTEQRFSASSTVSSHITMSSSAFPASPQQLAGSNPSQRVTATYSQSPASFLSSILPSQPDYNSRKTPSSVDST